MNEFIPDNDLDGGVNHDTSLDNIHTISEDMENLIPNDSHKVVRSDARFCREFMSSSQEGLDGLSLNDGSTSKYESLHDQGICII